MAACSNFWLHKHLYKDVIVASQVRSFAKETAACAKYEKSVKSVLKWGLKSAFASGLFFGINFAFATGKAPMKAPFVRIFQVTRQNGIFATMNVVCHSNVCSNLQIIASMS